MSLIEKLRAFIASQTDSPEQDAAWAATTELQAALAEARTERDALRRHVGTMDERDALQTNIAALADKVKDLQAKAAERLIAYCVCKQSKSPAEGCNCVACTTARLESERDALLQQVVR